jgi:hypothetical protein
MYIYIWYKINIIDRYLNLVFNKFIWKYKCCTYFHKFGQICDMNTNNDHQFGTEGVFIWTTSSKGLCPIRLYKSIYFPKK